MLANKTMLLPSDSVIAEYYGMGIYNIIIQFLFMVNGVSFDACDWCWSQSIIMYDG